ncbi:hypothetical protein ALI22I_44040 [Saccharothrix sp. ALI-22-I]|uniref:hypothetical protein n=1 Tax=Saccharothrix sp. ALI-22-I TaxID=1933778 RepID=UPI0009D4EFAA|nr:hypothetical protein [Saccharothrix sp. ALI-22-I]ONI80325.1 hypothetical protein ALI22I_44040 [Saccharothrix sp. ALI-22-I]
MGLWKSRPEPEPFVDRPQARLAFMLAEYNTIRTELVAAVSTQQTVMTYGLAAIAVIYSGLLASWSNVPVRTGILSLAPVLLVFVWFVWFGEVQRLGRARWYLWELEQKVNALLRPEQDVPSGSALPASDVLHWESWVRGRNKWRTNVHSRPAYHLATGLLCGTGLGTTVLSVVLSQVSRPGGPLQALVFGGAALFLALLWYAWFVFRRHPFIGNGKPISD